MSFWTRRRVALWIGLGLWLWMLAVVVSLIEARNHLELARAEAESTADTPTDELDLDRLAERARTITTELTRADARANHPILLPLKPLPVVGRHLRVVQSISRTASDAATLSIRILETVESYRNGDGRTRSELLAAIEQDLILLDETLRRADAGPGQNLLASVAEARTEFESRLVEARDGIAEARVIVRGLRAFADDSDYLLLGANNAEMRLGSGMVLSVGELSTVDGEFVLDRLVPSHSRFPVPQVPPSGVDPVDDDIRSRWGFLAPTNDYRKLTYTARFAEYTGPQSLVMWEAQTGRRPDGAVLLDPFVLDALVGVIGSVSVEGEEFTQGMTLDYLLRDQYARYGNEAEEIEARQDRLSVIAEAVVEKLGSDGFDPVRMFRSLRPLVRGRHLMVYSSDPDQQQAWRALGVAGELDGDETGVYLLNVGASKLDPYIDLSVAAELEPALGQELRTVRYQVTVTNTLTDPGSLPDYAVGPWEHIPLPTRGAYPARLVVYAPARATGLRFEPDQPLEVYGADGQVWVMSTLVMVLPGESLVIDVAYELPIGMETIEVEPSARFPPVTWSLGAFRSDDSQRFNLTLASP